MAGTCGYGEELSGSINAGNFLTSGKVYWLASQEGLCSMEKVSNSEFITSIYMELLYRIITLTLLLSVIALPAVIYLALFNAEVCKH